MTPLNRILLAAVLLVPGALSAQTFTVNGPFDPAKYAPLSGSSRWQRWWREDGAGPALHVQSLAAAAYFQVIEDPTKWGTGGDGFARRAGSSYGGNLIENSVHESMAGLEQTDPRYFLCGCSGFFRRSAYAVKMTFLTHNRSGHLTLDVPQLAGAYAGSMIEDTWWPHHYSARVQGVQSGHIVIGIIGAEHILQEFSPELKRLIPRHKTQPAAK